MNDEIFKGIISKLNTINVDIEIEKNEINSVEVEDFVDVDGYAVNYCISIWGSVNYDNGDYYTPPAYDDNLSLTVENVGIDNDYGDELSLTSEQEKILKEHVELIISINY